MSCRRATVAAAVAVLALGPAGCGGDDSSDEDEVRELVSTFYENAEGVCDRLTNRLLERQFGSREACEKEADAAQPQQGYEIGSVSLDGDRGRVEIEVGEQRGELVVTKENDEWKVDDARPAPPDEGTATTPPTAPEEGTETTP